MRLSLSLVSNKKFGEFNGTVEKIISNGREFTTKQELKDLFNGDENREVTVICEYCSFTFKVKNVLGWNF